MACQEILYAPVYNRAAVINAGGGYSRNKMAAYGASRAKLFRLLQKRISGEKYFRMHGVGEE